MTQIKFIFAAVIICALVSLGVVANHYRNSAIESQNELDKATARADVSDLVTRSVISSSLAINQISQATQHDKQKLATTGETKVVVIRQQVKGDPCANQLVPAAAADSLREYADSLRAGTAGTNQRGPDG